MADDSPLGKMNLVASMYERDQAKKKKPVDPDNNEKIKYEAFGDDYDEDSPTKRKVKPSDISKSIKKYTDQ